MAAGSASVTGLDASTFIFINRILDANCYKNNRMPTAHHAFNCTNFIGLVAKKLAIANIGLYTLIIS